MNVTEARLFAESLLAAANRAEAEGRDRLLETDLDVFSAAVDKARAELQAAIDRAN